MNLSRFFTVAGAVFAVSGLTAALMSYAGSDLGFHGLDLLLAAVGVFFLIARLLELDEEEGMLAIKAGSFALVAFSLAWFALNRDAAMIAPVLLGIFAGVVGMGVLAYERSLLDQEVAGGEPGEIEIKIRQL